jgi:ubiquinone/menaquinone biosynthesis C-methylase UbiE
MLRLAQRYATKFHFAAELIQANVTSLPFATASFDWAISVATYHHLKTGEARSVAFHELYRILKPGGEAFVTVWNRTQPRFIFEGRETLVPWKCKNETLYRYYYLFTYPEITKLAKEAGFTLLKVSPEKNHRGLRYLSRNICLLVRKQPLPILLTDGRRSVRFS